MNQAFSLDNILPYSVPYSIAIRPFVNNIRLDETAFDDSAHLKKRKNSHNHILLNTVPETHQHPGFDAFINNLLIRAKLEDKHRAILTESQNLITFAKSFTAPSVSENNYEFAELLGDSALNWCIVSYLKNKFKQLNCSLGVKYIARLKIDYVSKQKFSAYAQKLNFDQFIRCSEDERAHGKVKRSVAEDCFEAFAGTLMTLCDEIEPYSGYKYCYQFIESIMNSEIISLKQENLFDPKSRLKELFDVMKNFELIYEYEYKKDVVKKQTTFTTRISVIMPDRSKILLATASEFTKKMSSQIAAKAAIAELKKRNMYRDTFVDTLGVSG